MKDQKALITSEQSEAIEFLKSEGYSTDDMLKNHYKWSSEKCACLNTIYIGEFARCLFIGYEIEEKKNQFNTADIVRWINMKGKRNGLFEIVQPKGLYAVTITNDGCDSEYTVENTDLILVCKVDNREDL